MQIFRGFSKKVLAFLVAITVIVSSLLISMAVPTVVSSAGPIIWGGEYAGSYAGGSGTENDPYLISTPEQLARMIGYDVLTNYTANITNGTTGKYFKLTADIYLNDVSNDKWYEGSNVNYWYNTATARFCGNLDGDGHTIYGLCFAPGSTYAGLLGFVDAWGGTRTIKNLTISDSYIRGTYAGGIAAIAKSGVAGNKIIFENCVVTDSVKIEGTSTSSNNNYGYAAGFIGYTYTGNTNVFDFNNCASLATKPDGTKLKFGFMGYNATWYSEQYFSISNCFAFAESWQGITSKGTISKSHLVDTLDSIKGALAKVNMPDLNWNIWNVTQSYPSLKPVDPNGTVGAVWSGLIAEKYAGGSGTKNDPYIIETPEQLARMVGYDVLTNYSGNINNGSVNKYYKLMADIYLNDVSTSDWYNSPVVNKWFASNASRFCGNFDGNGYTIYGLYADPAAAYNGLFPVIDAWTGNRYFKNITISDSYLVSNNSGAFVGAIGGRIYSDNNKTVYFDNCYITDSVTFNESSPSTYIAGMIGYAHPSAKSFYAFTGCAVLSKSTTGSALVGYQPASGTVLVTNCFTVDAKWCPNNRASVTDSYIVSDISKIYGAAAKNTMPSLSWNYIWQTQENGYPTYFNREYDQNGTMGGVWTGLTATEYAGGSGTDVDPYKIATAEQFMKMLKDSANEGKYFELIADIKFNDTSSSNWKETARAWSNISNRFKGHFDGKGHTVSGLYCDGTQNNIGLFCVAQDCIIENVILDNSYIKSTGYAIGGIIGQGVGTVKVNNCIVTGNVYIESTYEGNDAGAGGIIGYGGCTVKINGCAVLATVKATKFAGSMAGNCWTAVSVKNSYSNQNMKFCTKRDLEQDSDFNYSPYAEDKYVISVDKDGMTGETAMNVMSGLDWARTWNTSDGYPVNKFAKDEGSAEGIWSGDIATEFAGGSGTKADPYLIENGEQLALMVTDTTSEGKYYKLVSDIKLNDTTVNKWRYYARQWVWTTNIFQGNFDGDNHTITGLYYNGTKSKIGLFSYAKNAVISNLVIDEAYVHSTGFAVGAILGDANSGKVTLRSCYVGKNVDLESTYNKGGDAGAGGLIGYGGAELLVEGCAFLGKVKAPRNAGAILGNCWGKNNEGASGLTVKHTYSNSSLVFCSKQSLGGNSANNYSACEETQTNVYMIKASEMTGKDAKKNMSNLDWFRYWKTTSTYPMINGGYSEGEVGKVWSGRIATQFAGGSGTKADPYLIATGEQLAFLLEDVTNTADKYYKITTDIYLNDVSKNNWYEGDNLRSWYWISTARYGCFKGHLDGDGHVIYGLYYNFTQNNSVVYAGLFPTIANGASVEKVGFSQARITIKGSTSTETYAGCIAGVTMLTKPEAETQPSELPIISQCFGDKTVVVTAKFAGGLLGGGSYVPNMDNCYFIGQVEGERVAAIIGNTWTEYEGVAIENCYSATDDAQLLVGGRAAVTNSTTPILYRNNYSNAGGLGGFVSQVSLLMMRGDAAKKHMSTLDFDKIWYALPNGTPVLRAFGTTDKFSNTTTPDLIEVSFVTNGGSECENIYGNPEEPITLPTPTREGYKFVGWYIYKELDMPYSIDTFPYFNTILYAKWEAVGIIMDFEKYPNTEYDYDNDYEYYRPGTVGYDAKYVRGGLASMHRKGTVDKEQDFLINYEEMLTIGKTYKMTFWVTTDKDNTKATLSLVHEVYPDVFDDDCGVQEIKVLDSMKDGEWQEVEITFVAKSKWVAIRTSGNASIYFDDMMIVETNEKADAIATAADFDIVPIIIIGVAALVLIAAIIAVVIIIKKKKKNKV